MSKDQDQKAQPKNNVFHAVAMDGLQVAREGYQKSTSGNQLMTEGVQRGQRHHVTGLQPREYGQQTAPSSSPQRTFAPANGPKVPPKKP